MAFISENLQILATLGSALAVYIFLRVGSRKDVHVLEKKIERIEEKLDDMNMRLTKLEGRFDERGYWQSQAWKTGTDDKK